MKNIKILNVIFIVAFIISFIFYIRLETTITFILSLIFVFLGMLTSLYIGVTESEKERQRIIQENSDTNRDSRVNNSQSS